VTAAKTAKENTSIPYIIVILKIIPKISTMIHFTKLAMSILVHKIQKFMIVSNFTDIQILKTLEGIPVSLMNSIY
jgi:hypothetical protein